MNDRIDFNPCWYAET